jgi:hypothetical protein
MERRHEFEIELIVPEFEPWFVQLRQALLGGKE